MLRRQIPVLGLLVLAVAALSLVPEVASARPRNRQGNNQQQQMGYQQQQPIYFGDQGQMPYLINGQPVVISQGQQIGQPIILQGQQFGQPMIQQTLSQRQDLAQQGQLTGYRAYYRVPTPDAPAGAVLLNLTVAPDARVWIDGAATQQQGLTRRFVSPQLDQNRQFTYVVKAQWQENGREVTRTRRVPVQAGQEVFVNLLQPTQEDLRQNGAQDDDQPRRNRTQGDADEATPSRAKTDADQPRQNRKKTDSDEKDK